MKNAVGSRVLCCLMVMSLSGIARASDLEFTPIISFDEQLFPSYIISTATMKPPEVDPEAEVVPPIVIGDSRGLLGVQLTAPSANAAVKVTVTCDDVMEPSTFTGKLPDAGTDYLIMPRIKYRFAKLAEVKQAMPVSVTFTVTVGKRESEQTSTVMLRPINDCPFLIQSGEQSSNISFSFAAYVNEQHPFIDKLLREALDIGVVESFTGYQGDQAEVIRQVYSIWDALVTRDVRYSSITATSVNAQSVACQHVRLIEESLNNSQANCVDGSVLFASALRKIGIEPFLILKPGHCYVGFYVDEAKETLLALETTMLGTSFGEDEEYQTLELLEESVDEDSRFPESWPSFASAIVAGSQDFEDNRAKFDDPAEVEYLLIDIAAARAMGIVPIAFRGKEEFQSNGLQLADSTEESEEMVESDDEAEEEE